MTCTVRGGCRRAESAGWRGSSRRRARPSGCGRAREELVRRARGGTARSWKDALISTGRDAFDQVRALDALTLRLGGSSRRVEHLREPLLVSLPAREAADGSQHGTHNGTPPIVVGKLDHDGRADGEAMAIGLLLALLAHLSLALRLCLPFDLLLVVARQLVDLALVLDAVEWVRPSLLRRASGSGDRAAPLAAPGPLATRPRAGRVVPIVVLVRVLFGRELERRPSLPGWAGLRHCTRRRCWRRGRRTRFARLGRLLKRRAGGRWRGKARRGGPGRERDRKGGRGGCDGLDTLRARRRDADCGRLRRV